MPKKTKQTPETLAEALRPYVEEVIAERGYYLVDVEVRGHRGTRVVEVYLDAEDEDVELDGLAEVSRELGFLLDLEDVIDGAYKLEVSSPGVDRPLAGVRQFKKNVGRPLRVRYDSEGKSEKIEGTLQDATEDTIEIETGAGQTTRVPLTAVTEAKVVLPW